MHLGAHPQAPLLHTMHINCLGAFITLCKTMLHDLSLSQWYSYSTDFDRANIGQPVGMGWSTLHKNTSRSFQSRKKFHLPGCGDEAAWGGDIRLDIKLE